MSWKSISVFVTDLGIDGKALDAAADIAAREDGHLDVVCLGIDPTQPDFYYTGAHAVTLPAALAEAERQAREVEAEVRQRLERNACRWSAVGMSTQIAGIGYSVADACRFSDLVVSARPYGPGRSTVQASIVEAALFGAGVPVLVTPDAGLPQSFRHVLLAWNDSPEAMRAARAALPLMVRAGRVEIVIIDPPRHGPDRSDPGGRLAQMLSRHGVHVDIRILARTLPGIADLLAREAADRNADLLVMGAYGHSRLRESIMGGATRDMLEAAQVPVLMVH